MDDECDDYTDIAVHDEHYVLACVCTCVLVCDVHVHQSALETVGVVGHKN